MLYISQITTLSLNKSRLPCNVYRNLNRPSRSKNGLSIFNEFANQVYNEGVNNLNSSGGIQDGGGPLTLSIKSIKNFSQKFKTLICNSNEKVFTILWVGIGMAEEAIILTKYLRAQEPPIIIQIDGVEMSTHCVNEANRIIRKYNCQDTITVNELNFMKYNPNRKYNCTYTSAAVNDIFNWKLLHTSIQCNATWCFHSAPSSRSYNFLKIPQRGYHRNWTKGELTGSSEKRNISVIIIPYINDSMKQELVDRSRQYLIHEFQRMFVGSSDKIYNLYQLAKSRNEMILTLPFNQLNGPHYCDGEIIWRDFSIDLETESSSSIVSNLDARVVISSFRDRIRDHYLEQYESKQFPLIIFPDLGVNENESDGENESVSQ